MEQSYYETVINSKMDMGQRALTDILSFIEKRITVPVDVYYDLKLIFSELIFNSIIHGNKSDSSKKIVLKVSVSDTGFVCASIRDEGEGFDYSGLIKKLSTGPDIFSENGRGIQLVTALADSVRFSGSGNEIEILKKVDLKDVQHYSCRQ